MSAQVGILKKKIIGDGKKVSKINSTGPFVVHNNIHLLFINYDKSAHYGQIWRLIRFLCITRGEFTKKFKNRYRSVSRSTKRTNVTILSFRSAIYNKSC